MILRFVIINNYYNIGLSKNQLLNQIKLFALLHICEKSHSISALFMYIYSKQRKIAYKYITTQYTQIATDETCFFVTT